MLTYLFLTPNSVIGCGIVSNELNAYGRVNDTFVFMTVMDHIYHIFNWTQWQCFDCNFVLTEQIKFFMTKNWHQTWIKINLYLKIDHKKVQTYQMKICGSLV